MAGAFSKYLQPRIKQPMARDKAIAVNEAIKDARLIKTRKKLRRLEDEANAQPVLAPSQPFDRQAFASFCNDWDTEIQTLSEDEQDRLYKQIEPFFAGKILGDEWRAIVNMLRAIRAASRAPSYPQRTNKYAYGYWGSFDGF